MYVVMFLHKFNLSLDFGILCYLEFILKGCLVCGDKVEGECEGIVIEGG